MFKLNTDSDVAATAIDDVLGLVSAEVIRGDIDLSLYGIASRCKPWGTFGELRCL